MQLPLEDVKVLDLSHALAGPFCSTMLGDFGAQQVQARGMIVESEHPVAGKVQVVGVPVKLSKTPGSVREPAPLLGQHTDEVLHEYLGMTDAEISALRQEGVIGTKR